MSWGQAQGRNRTSPPRRPKASVRTIGLLLCRRSGRKLGGACLRLQCLGHTCDHANGGTPGTGVSPERRKFLLRTRVSNFVFGREYYFRISILPSWPASIILPKHPYQSCFSHFFNPERPQTLRSTAWVNEAYLCLLDIEAVRWQDRTHFFAVSAQIMLRILGDSPRAHLPSNRGGRLSRVCLGDSMDASREAVMRTLSL